MGYGPNDNSDHLRTRITRPLVYVSAGIRLAKEDQFVVSRESFCVGEITSASSKARNPLEPGTLASSDPELRSQSFQAFGGERTGEAKRPMQRGRMRRPLCLEEPTFTTSFSLPMALLFAPAEL